MAPEKKSEKFEILREAPENKNLKKKSLTWGATFLVGIACCTHTTHATTIVATTQHTNKKGAGVCSTAPKRHNQR